MAAHLVSLALGGGEDLVPLALGSRLQLGGLALGACPQLGDFTLGPVAVLAALAAPLLRRTFRQAMTKLGQASA